MVSAAFAPDQGLANAVCQAAQRTRNGSARRSTKVGFTNNRQTVRQRCCFYTYIGSHAFRPPLLPEPSMQRMKKETRGMWLDVLGVVASEQRGVNSPQKKPNPHPASTQGPPKVLSLRESGEWEKARKILQNALIAIDQWRKGNKKVKSKSKANKQKKARNQAWLLGNNMVTQTLFNEPSETTTSSSTKNTKEKVNK